MQLTEYDIIIGVHSIAEAIKNHKRLAYKLYATNDGLNELKKLSGLTDEEIRRGEVQILKPHRLQQEAKTIFEKKSFKYIRVPSNVFLIAAPLEEYSLKNIYSDLEMGGQKILCLDQITDPHNGGAIVRTAAFYGVDYLLVSLKGNFGKSPGFFRISSGGAEHVKVVNCSSLPKALKKLQELGVECIGLSEHASEGEKISAENKNRCLVLGAEDKGLSHAVERIIERKVALKGRGVIKSLNVSVAAALGMEKFLI